MKARQKYTVLVILLFLVSGMVFAQTSAPVITEVRQESDGTMRVSWSVGSEDGIDHYEILRSTGTGMFSHIGDVPHGTFFFIDNYDLFKTSGKYFRYQVIAVRADKSIVGQSVPVGASYNSTSSAAKRTWGSIKAMFR